MIPPDVTMWLAGPHEDVELRRRESRVSVRRGSRAEVLIDHVDEDVAAVHFELAVDRYVADGYSPRTQAAARSVPGTPPDDAGYAFAFAAKVGGARGELIKAQALRLWEDDQAARDAERAAIEAIDFQVHFYGLLDDHLLLIPDGPAIHAYIDGHDVVSLVDGLATAKGMTPGRLGFDPRCDPWRIDLMGRHRLRSLLAGEHMSRLRSLRIRTWGGTAHLDPVLSSYSAGDRLSHLCLWSQRDDLVEAPVAGRYPGLRALECPAWQVARLLRDGAPRLHTLVAFGTHADTPSLLDMLADLSLPALRHLALWETDVDPTTLGASPVVARLATLDLWKVNDAPRFDFSALLRHRRDLAHLERIVVPGHCVPSTTVSRFADWPQVTFAGYDRRELLALDLDTLGYTNAM
ncbi:hypothetical protein IMZ11_06510 [Microtetraspora sp. AC03309]|uniref:hypothetical protein n=1 Tax=Microtetraspora sp. AC03309 TaxID=2779376 RepID=UPI001E4D716D|nr:hypothetical protein [Microtetraspora sp. AC03309]MCC5575294.1 hypothetical protein [Microtetraspora sp. AC03309]